MLWQKWLPGLSGSPSFPWALLPDEVAPNRLERSLGTYSADLQRTWVLDYHCDAAEVADYMPGDPNVWSDGSCVNDDLAGISVAGAGVFSMNSSISWSDAANPERRRVDRAVCNLRLVTRAYLFVDLGLVSCACC